MATINITRKRGFSKTRKRRVAVAEINFSDLSAGVVNDDFEIFTIPENCIITRRYLRVTEAAQATATCDIGTTAGGAELGSNLSIAVLASSDSGALVIATGTGVTVTFTPETVLPTQGNFVVVVEYIQYETADGELSALSET